MLPKLYTLRVHAVIGEVVYITPALIYCLECGRAVDHYREVEIVVDEWPQCDLIEASGGARFVSERLLMELKRVGASGFSDWPATVTPSEEAARDHPSLEGSGDSMSQYRHLVVTGRCDGPWVENVRGRPCRHCKQHVPEPVGFGSSVRRLVEGIVAGPRLVYIDSWHGEDFFEVTEPGPTIITERVADLLDSMGNLRKESIADREMVKRFMPKDAERLEKMGWEVPVCVSLGPADWVERP